MMFKIMQNNPHKIKIKNNKNFLNSFLYEEILKSINTPTVIKTIASINKITSALITILLITPFLYYLLFFVIILNKFFLHHRNIVLIH